VSRISSVSSQDSGFTSQEQFFARPPSPLEEAEVSKYFSVLSLIKRNWKNLA